MRPNVGIVAGRTDSVAHAESDVAAAVAVASVVPPPEQQRLEWPDQSCIALVTQLHSLAGRVFVVVRQQVVAAGLLNLIVLLTRALVMVVLSWPLSTLLDDAAVEGDDVVVAAVAD